MPPQVQERPRTPEQNRFSQPAEYKPAQQDQSKQGSLEKMMAAQTEMMKHMADMMTKLVNNQVMPSQVEPNPNSKKEAQPKQVVFRDPGTSRQNAQEIHLRSGKNLESPQEKPREHREKENEELPDEENVKENDSSKEEKTSINEKIRIPFPEALKEKRKLPKGNTQEIEDIFKNVIIEIPLFKALEQIPAYAKYMKQKCTPK